MGGSRKHLLAIITFGSLRAPVQGEVRAAWEMRVNLLGSRLSAEDVSQIGAWIVDVTAIVGALGAEAARQDKEFFHARLNLLRKGGRESFAFAQEPTSVRHDLLDADVFGKSSAQSAVEAELEKWRTSCWLPPALSSTRASCPEAPSLPMFSMKDLDEALLSFSWHTGLGADQAHPRHVYFCVFGGQKVVTHLAHSR